MKISSNGLFTCSKFHLLSIYQAQSTVSSADPIGIVSAHTGQYEDDINISFL